MVRQLVGATLAIGALLLSQLDLVSADLGARYIVSENQECLGPVFSEEYFPGESCLNASDLDNVTKWTILETEYLSVHINCTNGGGLVFYESEDCQGGNAGFGDYMCLSQWDELDQERIAFFECDPPETPTPVGEEETLQPSTTPVAITTFTLDTFKNATSPGLCRAEGGGIPWGFYGESDGCVNAVDKGLTAFIVDSVSYASVYILCGLSKQFYFNELPDCLGNSSTTYMDTYCGTGYDYFETETLLDFEIACYALPTDPPTYNLTTYSDSAVPQTCAAGGGDTVTTSSGYDGCVNAADIGVAHFVINEQEYLSVYIDCQFSQVFFFYPGQDCALYEYPVGGGYVCGTALEDFVNNRTLDFDIICTGEGGTTPPSTFPEPPPPTAPPAYFFESCSPRYNESPYQGFGDGCLSYPMTIGGEEAASILISCSNSDNQTIEVYGEEQCSGEPLVILNGSDPHCTSIDLNFEGHRTNRLFQCRDPYPLVVYQADEYQCLATNPSPVDDLGCISFPDTQFQIVGDYEPTLYSSFSTSCGWPGGSGINFYPFANCQGAVVASREANEPVCIEWINMTSSSSFYQPFKCRVAEPPPSYVYQVHSNATSPEMCDGGSDWGGPGKDGCANARGYGFESFIANSQEYLSVFASCGSENQTENGFVFYDQEDCEGTPSPGILFGTACARGFYTYTGASLDVSFTCMGSLTPPPSPEGISAVLIYKSENNTGVCDEEFMELAETKNNMACVRAQDSGASLFTVNGNVVHSYSVNCNSQYPFTLYEEDNCTGPPAQSVPMLCGAEITVSGPIDYFAKCNPEFYYGIPAGSMRLEENEQQCHPSNHSNPFGTFPNSCSEMPSIEAHGETYKSIKFNCSFANEPGYGISYYNTTNCTGPGTEPVVEDCFTVIAGEDHQDSYAVWCWTEIQTVSPFGGASPAVSPVVSPVVSPGAQPTSAVVTTYTNNTSSGTCHGLIDEVDYRSYDCMDSTYEEFDSITFGNKTYYSVQLDCEGLNGQPGITFFEGPYCSFGNQSETFFEVCAEATHHNQTIDVHLKCLTNQTVADKVTARYRNGGVCQPTNHTVATGNLTNGCYNRTAVGNLGWKVGNTTYHAVHIDCGTPEENGNGIQFYTNESCSGGSTSAQMVTACADALLPGNQSQFIQLWCLYPGNITTSAPITSFPSKAPTTKVPTNNLPTKIPTRGPTTRQPTNIPTLQPTKTPTNQPTKSPTISGPSIQSAILTQDLTKIEVRFVSDTNQRNSPQRGPCAPWLTFHSDDTGCGGMACNVTCVWNSPRRFSVELNALSNFKIQNLSINLAENSDVRDAFVPSGSSFGTVPVTVDLPNVVSPTVTISGPSTVSLCGNNSVIITSTVAGTGGRAPKYEWLDGQNNSIPNGNGSRLVITLPEDEETFTYKLRVTNFADKESVSKELSVEFIDTAFPQVLISSASTFSVGANVRVDLGAEVNLPKSCRAGSNTTTGYVYLWKIIKTGDPEVIQNPAGVSLNNSRLVLNPVSILDAENTYRIELEVDPGVAGVNSGSTSVLMTVKSAPVVAIARASVASLFATDSLTLDASKSCNPNLASPTCYPGSGQNQKALAGLTFTWNCTDAAGVDCSSLCEVTAPAECVIPPNSLDDAKSPYQFKVKVSYNALQSESQPVSVTVFPQREECNLPKIRMLDFPAKINVGESGEAALRAQVEGFDESPTAGRVFRWLDVSTGTASQVQKYVGQGITTRPNLVLQLSTLTPGSTYTFRLVAVQPCAGDANAFGEITFQTNSAPSGGVLTVSPMSGRAGLDEFTLFVDGAVDEDLPLSYSFEYRTDFTAGSTGKFLTLSSFSQSSSLKTRFKQANRILVVARVRDSLNAVTSRSVSPSVDNVKATELVIENPNVLPFKAEDELNDLKVSGGSDEDTLRVAGALATAAASDPATDPQTLDPEVLDWKKQTQTKLLDVVVSTAVEDPDPSFVMLQASALSSILSSASQIQDVNTEDGQAFLAKAADFVGNLLQNAQNAILAKGEGENDPLLSQYRPSDLGDVTVSSLMSILDAIKSSSLNARRRLRRRLLRGESLESDQEYRRYLQAEEATKTVVGTVRDQLRALAETLLLGAVSGAAPQVVNGAEMRVVAVSEVPSLIGQNTSLRTISIPAFDESDPPTIFTLPQALLDQYEFGESELVKILAVRFRFNIRELAGGVNLPNLTLDENGPVNNITEMLALDFQRNSTDRSIHPFDLTESIRIQIPLEYSEPDNTTRPSCGYFDTEENVWSSFGCNVTEFSLPVDETDKTGYIICECNHASDYAAWQAFVKDVNSVFNPVDTSNLSTIAALVLGVLLPSISLAWIISQYFGQRWDKRDSDYVHYGAFVALTKRKLELHDRQRRFFKFLRTNTEPIPVDEILRLKQVAEERERRELEEKTRAEFEKIVYRLVLLIFSGSLVSFAMCFTGVFVSNFVSASTASLVAADFPNQSAAMGLALASGIVSLLVALNTLEALLFREGKLAKSTSYTGRFQIVIVSEFLAAVLGVAAFAVGVAYTADTTPGAGLGLVIAAGCISILNTLFAFLAFFIHQHGQNSRRHGAEFIRNVVRSILYEQTLISAFSRFDPFFDRQKRFSIVIAVIVGNLFACSVFFSLRQGESVSFGLVLASTFISSMIVAIPVKVAMRVLFKVTRSRTGSKMDRIAQIFRMTAFNYDVHPYYTNEAEKLDVEMLAKFRRFYVAKHNFRLLEMAVRQSKAVGSASSGNLVGDEDKRKTMMKMFSSKSNGGNFSNRNLVGDEENKKALLKMFSMKMVINGEEFHTYQFKEQSSRELVVRQESTKEMPVPSETATLAPKTAEWTNRQTGEFENIMVNNAESGTGLDLMDVREVINKSGTITPEIIKLAKFQLHKAKEELKVTLEEARKAWEKFERIKWSTVTRKQAIVRRERNAFLKLAVSMSDEPHPRPRVYETMLPSYSVYLGWLIMFVYYTGCILWICFWIFSRNGQSRDALVAQGIDEPTNEQVSAETNAYLLAWLGTSFFGVFLAYFVFEPALVVMRYAILPLWVKTLRPENPVTVDELKEDELEPEDEEKPATWCARIFCCGCCRSVEAMKKVEKNVGDGIILVIEALV